MCLHGKNKMDILEHIFSVSFQCNFETDHTESFYSVKDSVL